MLAKTEVKCVVLLLRIPEVPVSNLGVETGYSELLVVSPSLPGKRWISSANWDTTASPSGSLFTDHPTLRRYTVRALGSVAQ
jgi:hypothetical protein